MLTKFIIFMISFICFSLNAAAIELLTTAQTQPYAKACGDADKNLEGDFSYYRGIILDDSTHSYHYGDKAREANIRIGDSKELFLVILEQDFYDVRGLKKYRITLCDFTIDEGTMVIHWQPKCDGFFQTFDFVSKKPPMEDDFEEVLFYHDQLVIRDAACY